MSFLRKKKKTPNVTQLVTSNMPRGRGRKGGIPPRQRKPAQAPVTRVPMNVGYLDSSITETAHCQSAPPPGYHFSPRPMYTGYQFPGPSMFNSPTPANPFKLCFIKGNISVCIGCNNRYSKSPKPPDDLCIKHQEWRQFTPQGSDVPQSKYTNVYYHCKPECVWFRNPYFIPQSLQIDEVVDQLLPEHKSLLSSYGINFPED